MEKIDIGTWIEVTFTSGVKWTGILEMWDEEEEEAIRIENGLSREDSTYKAAECAFVEIEAVIPTDKREFEIPEP